MRVIGIPVSPGVVVGRAVVLTGHADVVRFPIARERIDDELQTLQQAREQSHGQLREIRERLANGPGHDLAPLFDAQLLILDDSMFLGRAKEIIRDERVNAAWAVHRAYEELCAVFATVEDPYLRERDSDLADVAGRVRMNLRRAGGWTTDMVHDVDGPAVLIADELTASLAAQMDWSRVLGFATDAGGRTHHTAILARSLKVPAVVGLRDLSRRVRPGTPVVIDGTSGQVTVDPTPDEITEAQRRAPERRRARPVSAEPLKPAVTLDGVAIRLDANLERVEDVPALLEAGAEGVGLFRSEFLLAGRTADHLSEDQQVEIYRGLLAALAPRPVTIRTFDVDERTPGPWTSRDRRDTRPGLRGVRLSLARPELLKTQLRALLRAAPAGHLRVMFPFVTSVEEMRAARMIMREVETALGARASAPVPVGAMVEVPSAALAADLLAPDAAFFTVGTNDLIQYTLAVDRTDERVSDLYAPLHPAVIRLLRLVRRAASRHAIDASVCGEMASDPAMIALLVGLGFRAFSMTASAIPIARRIVQDLRTSDARRTASEALRLATSEEVEQHLFEALAAVNRRPASR